MGAPDPHYKYLLEKINGGIRSGGDRFRHVNLLLYAVSRNPPPIWFNKIPSAVMKDLLDVLSPSRDSDVNVLVSGVMVIVLLLPAQPLELTKYLTKIFECFWKLVHWTPTRVQDVSLKPYLQVAVYSLFHRLYALYPCNLLGYMRVHMLGQANKSWFLNTLRPMIERVRLHPLLLSETKETELFKNRWIGLEPCELMHECAKLCLDPLQEICEEVHFNSSKRQSICDSVPETSEYIILYSSESNFWSPGAVQSPSTINTSVPHTPVYPFQLLGNQSTGIAESPPEAAVEATPETTPFTSPSPFQTASKRDPRVAQNPPKLRASLSEPGQETRLPLSPLSPGSKGVPPFRFPSKISQDILLRSEKSDLLQNKLQEIQRQRVVRQKEAASSLAATNASYGLENCKEINSILKSRSQEECRVPFVEMSRKFAADHCSTAQAEDADAKKKTKVRRYGMCEFQHTEFDPLFLGKKLEENEKSQPDLQVTLSLLENLESAELTQKDSQESDFENDEGLGVPCRQSMTELVKNVKTNRLRFLSQCGPPPNIALLNEAGTKRSGSPTKSRNIFLSPKIRHKSRSFPNLFKDNFYVLPSILPKRELTISTLSLSPVKPPVETFEVATQTEESQIIDPHEQLLEVLLHNRSREINDNSEKEKRSPYEILDEFIEYNCSDGSTPCQDTSWNVLSHDLSDTSKNHLRAMQCLMVLERHKREVHAERNRRLLGKIKRLHLLQEKEKGLQKEKAAMKEEMMSMQQTLVQFQEKNKLLEKRIGEMVERQALVEAEEKRTRLSCQRDHLKELCDSLEKGKMVLIKELEQSQSEVRECQRQLKIHLRHSAENTTLRTQVEDLNKRIMIMGEIQLEMQQQMRRDRESHSQAKPSVSVNEKTPLSQKVEQLEQKYHSEKLSLDAAMFRVGELERKLAAQQIEKQKHRQEIESTGASWKERCNALEKRNKELCSINITLESQMTQMLRFRPEREAEEGAGARRLVPPTNREVFPLPVGARGAEAFPDVPGDSFIARMTCQEFKSIGSVNPDEL